MKTNLFSGSNKQTFWTQNWYYLYFVLAVFDIIAIGISLALSHSNLNKYDQVIEYTDSKIKILNLIGEVSQLAQQVNAPGNDVFDSKNVANERTRFANAKESYDKKVLELQSMTVNAPRGESAIKSTNAEIKGIESIALNMAQMGETANEIFDYFERKEVARAAALMSEMDRRYAKLQIAIEKFRGLQAEKISLNLLDRRQGLQTSKELEWLLSGLILLAVIGITIFGSHLSRFVKNALLDAQRNREILDSVAESAIVAFTDKRGKITDVNNNFCKISGYSREELIGRDHRIIKSGAHSNIFFKDLWQTISAGGVWTGDIQNLKKSGETYFVRSVISPLKGANGEIEQYMAIRFDITEQKRIEKELLEAQETAKIGSWKFDLLSGHLLWSPEHYRIFEIDEPQSQENLLTLYRERVHPEDRAEVDRVLDQALKTGKDFVFNHRVYVLSGHKRHTNGHSLS